MIVIWATYGLLVILIVGIAILWMKEVRRSKDQQARYDAEQQAAKQASAQFVEKRIRARKRVDHELGRDTDDRS